MTKVTIPMCKANFTNILITILTVCLMMFFVGVIYFVVSEMELPVMILLTAMILFVEGMLTYMILLIWGKESLMECSNPFKFKC